MIFGKTKLELKVGIFVFIGIVFLSIFVLSIGGIKTWSSGYHINFLFNFVNGAKLGAPVRFSGVDIGAIKKINFVFSGEEQKYKVNIDTWVKREVQIPSDSTVWVNTLGLLGEKYIEIIPGKDYGRVLNNNDTLVGVDPIPMHEVFRMSKNIIDNFNEGISKINEGKGTVGKLLYDDTVYNELEAMVKDLRRHPWKLFWKTKEKPEKPEKK
ncbi:MAG: MlaD family protein [Candidatus Omnitrophota bacterium]